MNEKYAKQIFKSPWRDLKEHLERDGIIVIKSHIPLDMAAAAIVENNSQTVNSWIESKDIGKPTEDQIESWNSNEEKPFLFFIAQPYVLIQELELQ